MKSYSIDFDLPKHILRCQGVNHVNYRLSASGKGFHFQWFCRKKHCKACSAIEQRFDDRKRYSHDRKRKPRERRILWDVKGGRRASLWETISKEKK